ncbi:unnamed protein product [marine sediment metagenome]|uniref:Replication-associated protein ORF2/G2P domain-containing protein n=1 Tax=marine sediment metagenome TaxID=412755 RepID=X1SNW6_9ZZZZ
MASSSITPTKQSNRAQDGCQPELERTPEVVAVSDEGQGAGLKSCPLSVTNLAVGQAGRGASLDTYVISRRSPTLDRAGKNLDDNRRIRRFYQRYFTGVGVGGRLRILTLTSSDEAVIEGYDIHRHFAALVKRLRRRWGVFQYIGVREVKGDREHLHLVFRGSYMAQVQLSAMWANIHKSPVVDIRHIYSWVRRDGRKVKVWNNPRGGACYLAKYLAKEAVNRYWASYDWVFRGWVGWSQRVKRAVGYYPSRALLRSLAVLDKVKRRLAMDFLEYQYRPLWEWSLANDKMSSGVDGL